MKKRMVSDKSFIKNSIFFEKRIIKHIDEIYSEKNMSQDALLSKHKSLLKYHISQLIEKLIKSYKHNPYRKMSGFVQKSTIKELKGSIFIMDEIKIWYEFDYDNGDLIFKYSEKYPTFFNRRFKRRVQLILHYSKLK